MIYITYILYILCNIVHITHIAQVHCRNTYYNEKRLPYYIQNYSNTEDINLLPRDDPMIDDLTLPKLYINGMVKSGTSSIYYNLCMLNNIQCHNKYENPNSKGYYFRKDENFNKNISVICNHNPYVISLRYERSGYYLMMLRYPIEWLYSYWRFHCFVDVDFWCVCDQCLKQSKNRLVDMMKDMSDVDQSHVNGDNVYNIWRDDLKTVKHFIHQFHRDDGLPYDNNIYIDYDMLYRTNDDRLTQHMDVNIGWDFWMIKRYIYCNAIDNMIMLQFETILLIKSEYYKIYKEVILSELLNVFGIENDNLNMNLFDYNINNNNNRNELINTLQTVQYESFYCDLLNRFYDDCLLYNTIFDDDITCESNESNRTNNVYEICWYDKCGDLPSHDRFIMTYNRLINNYSLQLLSPGLVQGTRLYHID